MHVEFGYPSCISFRDIMWKNRQTDKQTNKHINAAEPTHTTTVGMGNDVKLRSVFGNCNLCISAVLSEVLKLRSHRAVPRSRLRRFRLKMPNDRRASGIAHHSCGQTCTSEVTSNN